MREEKKKSGTIPRSPREPLGEPRMPREWPPQPPGQLWPTPTPLSTAEIGEIRGILIEILGRLDVIEKRLSKIERVLARQPVAP